MQGRFLGTGRDICYQLQQFCEFFGLLWLCCFMRHLVFFFLNRLTCSLPSESGRTGERNFSNWSKVNILSLSASNLFFSSLLGKSCHMGSQYKKVNAKNVKDSFYGHERLNDFFRLLLMQLCLDFPTLTQFRIDWIMFSNSLLPCKKKLHPHALSLQCSPLFVESTSLSH